MQALKNQKKLLMLKRKSREDEIAKMAIKKYGNGASKFIGEALKFYSENSNS